MPYWRGKRVGWRRYGKRVVAQGARQVRKRYVRRSGIPKYAQLAKDVKYIKNSLNTERKEFTIQIKDSMSANQPDVNTASFNFGIARPTKTNPVIYRLALPERGVAYNQRVGNQIKITHMTCKLQLERVNKQAYQASIQYKCFIVFAKSGDEDLLNIQDLFDTDANGNYTPMCFSNNNKYKNFYRPRLLSKQGKIIEQIPQNAGGQSHYRYLNMQQKLNVRTVWRDSHDTDVNQMRPYIVFMSDDNSANDTDTDRLDVTGQIKISYVDN